MSRLEGKVAIITGAAGGMGAAEVRLFAKEGARVIATDLQEEELLETVKKINEEYGDKVIGVKHNVSVEDDWKVVVNKAIEHFGKIDILVNNAGIQSSFNGVAEVELSEFERTLSINAGGTFLGIKHVSPIMKKSNSGSIVNISSVAGLVGGQGGMAYTTSKGAVRLLTKSVALELAPFGIRVNSVHPGAIKTPMLDDLWSEEFEKQVMATIPLGYVANSEDVAYPVLFLASDESRYMTGTEVVVDGGITAG